MGCWNVRTDPEILELTPRFNFEFFYSVNVKLRGARRASLLNEGFGSITRSVASVGFFADFKSGKK